MKTAPIRAVIADDEALARLDLRSLILNQQGWELVAEADSGPVACETIRRTCPDVVFLDIRMPGQSGLEVAQLLTDMEPRPLIVFATAFDGHALEAFEVEAADYLLKPFDRKRFLTTVHRLERRLRQSDIPPPSAPISAGDSDEPTTKVLAVRSVGRVRLVNVSDIQWVAAAGNYVRLYLQDTCLLHRATLASLQSRLDEDAFLRIHRSTLVHRGQVAEIRTSASDRSRVVLHDGTELDISQRFRQRVVQALLPSP